MQHRQRGATQEMAAAKADISIRSGRRIEQSTLPRQKTKRQWRTREDLQNSKVQNSHPK